MSNQIVPQQQVALITEGDMKLANRIKAMLAYGEKLTHENALALVAFSRLHGLDPYNGEAYYLVREKRDAKTGEMIREELGCYPGIKGKRKLAKEQLRKIDQQATYTVQYSQAKPTDIGLGVKANDIAIVMRAELRDSITTGQYIVNTLQLAKAGYSEEKIEQIIGKAPVWTGYGVVYNRELAYIKQTPLDLAKKRAESSVTSQRFDLPFADDALADDVAPEITTIAESNGSEPADFERIVEGDFEQPRSESQIMHELGFDDEQEEFPEEFIIGQKEFPIDVKITGENPLMTLNEARNTKTAKGTQLGTLDVEQLALIIEKTNDANLRRAASICFDALIAEAEEAEDGTV